MSFEKTGRIPNLPEPTPAQERKIQVICATLTGHIVESQCSDLEAKAVVSNLVQRFGTLEQVSAAQRAVNQKKRRGSWKVR